MYAGGSAGTYSTYRANLRAFDRYAIIPRMLVNANKRSLEACCRSNLVLVDIECITDHNIWGRTFFTHPHGTNWGANHLPSRR